MIYSYFKYVRIVESIMDCIYILQAIPDEKLDEETKFWEQIRTHQVNSLSTFVLIKGTLSVMSFLPCELFSLISDLVAESGCKIVESR